MSRNLLGQSGSSRPLCAASPAALLVAGALASLGSTGAAFAACSPAPADNTVVNCEGTNLPALVASGFNAVTVNIAGDASITMPAQTGGTAPNFQFSSVAVGPGGTINNAGLIQNNGAQRRDNYGVNLAGSDTTLNNTGTISVNALTAGAGTNSRLYGVVSSAPDGVTYDNVQVTNAAGGTISLTQNTAGIARGVYSGENMAMFTFDNFGTVTVTKNGNAGATAAVAGVDSDDDTDTLVVNNHAGATIAVSGGNTYGVGGRAQDYQLQNDGTISATNGARAAILIYGGGDGGSGTAEIDNSASGVINGNVSITDTSPFGVTLPAATENTRDSTFTNEGTINGAFIYGAGTHTLDNTGTITGGITVNQQVGAGVTGVGGASFTLTNEGTLDGDIIINDRPDSVNSITLTGTGYAADGNIVATGNGMNNLVLDGVVELGSVQNFSSIDLMRSNVAVANGVSLVDGAQINTTIFGPGGSANNPTTNLGSIQGALTLQGNANITPSFAGIARNGDVYALASQVTSAGAITIDRTDLVSFTPSTNTGALLLTANLRDARTVAGITPAGGQVINGLLSYGGTNQNLQTLGATIESYTSDQQVASAGRALTPTLNGADVQLPINSTLLFNQQIDARLDTFLFDQLPITGRSADLGVPRPAPVFAAPRNAAWVEGIAGGVHQSSTQDMGGYNADLTGVIGGYDRFVLPNVRVGGAVGFINASINNNVNLSGTRETIGTYQGIVYAAYEGPHTYGRVSVGYGGVNYQASRQVSFTGFNDFVTGHHSGDILTVRGEGGVPIALRTGLVIPYAAFTYGHLHQGSYAEQSGAGAAFAFNSAVNESERSEVGGKVIVPIGDMPTFAQLFSGAVVALEGRAAYIHEFGNLGQTVTAGFAGTGVTPLVFSGATPNRDYVDFGAGVRVGSGPVIFDASYNGLARSTYFQQVGILRARYFF